MLRVAAAFLAILLATPAGAVGFQLAQIPQPDGRTLPGAFWYPSLAPPRPITVDSTRLLVAQDAPVDGAHHPLIVVSHGALGNRMGLADFASVLAKAGFVVAAISHDEIGPGGVLETVDRTHQLRSLVDYALDSWPGRASLDPSEIGALGFSLGGFTVLVAIGGKPNPSLIAPHCRLVPSEWSCTMIGRLDLALHAPPESAWAADPRIKAAVLAAPALGYVFGKRGLAGVHVPVQLWAAGDDHVLTEPWNADSIRADLPLPASFRDIPGAEHGDFSNVCTARQTAKTPGLCTDGTGFDRASLHRLVDGKMVAFFRRELEAAR